MKDKLRIIKKSYGDGSFHYEIQKRVGLFFKKWESVGSYRYFFGYRLFFVNEYTSLDEAQRDLWKFDTEYPQIEIVYSK